MGSLVARRSLVVALLISAFPVRARADESVPRVDVVWSGPEVCPRARFVEGLNRHLVDSDAAPVQVVADVSEDDGMWRLVTTLASDGEAFAPRSFAGRSCEAVVDAAALATAIAIDPHHVVDDPLPAVEVPEPEIAAADPPEPVIRAPVRAIPARATAAPEVAPVTVRTPPRRSSRGFAAIAAAIDGGALPGVGAGLATGVGLIRRRLRLELTGGWRAPVRVASLANPDVGARIDLLHVGARVCGLVAPARSLELALCGGLDSGVVRGRGFGLTRRRTARLWWNAAVASAAVYWVATRHFAVFARSELGVPLRLHEFAIAGLDRVDRIAPVFGRGQLGVEVRFP